MKEMSIKKFTDNTFYNIFFKSLHMVKIKKDYKVINKFEKKLKKKKIEAQ